MSDCYYSVIQYQRDFEAINIGVLVVSRASDTSQWKSKRKITDGLTRVMSFFSIDDDRCLRSTIKSFNGSLDSLLFDVFDKAKVDRFIETRANMIRLTELKSMKYYFDMDELFKELVSAI